MMILPEPRSTIWGREPLGHSQGAEDVGLEVPAHVGHRDLGYRPGFHDPGVVDQHVDLVGERHLTILLAGDVEHHRLELDTGRGRGRGQLGGLGRDLDASDDRVAATSQLERNTLAESASCSGDQYPLGHRCSLLW
jgi:hypothetical protein